MAKSAMPVSKATNAYQLLDEIATLINEEPKRYDQTDWLMQGDAVTRCYPGFEPACGTVGCVAGWVVALKGLTGHIWESAQQVLGLDLQQRADLFHGGAAGERRSEEDFEFTEESIRAHADRGIAHVRAFMARHETQLKAKKV